ncbi:MAG TPA: HhH-GPD-type base excision DNA repair protein [Acidimicrobiales bacterium]|nr:HhH-GPD-type base excision DNA repair protein [Acidimicrobiales bacterium]
MPKGLAVTGDAAADQLLNSDPLAALLGMLLDQQVPMEWAFMSPYRLKERLGGLDAAEIASMSPEQVEEVFKQKPALHRFPGSMGKRAHAVCVHLVEHYDGKADHIWNDVPSGDELYRRLREIPGFGDEKTKIFIALLAKRFGVTPDGWEEAAAPFSEDTPRSVADIFDDASLQRVREWKKAKKAAGKTKQD